MEKNTRDYWNEYSEERNLSRNRLLFVNHKQILDNFLNWFSKVDTRQKVLEVGCGDGFWMDIVRNLGFKEVYGIEPSKHYVDICEKKGFKTYHSTIEDFKPKEKFDWALFFDILEHVKNPKEVLKKCNSLLKNDGKVFINIPVYESLYEKFERLLKFSDKKTQSTTHDPTHIQYPSSREVDKWLEEAGFQKIISAHIYNPIPVIGIKMGAVVRSSTALTFFGRFGRFYSVVAKKL